MKIAKSSRHSKITGDFAESLILYWLSKYGFECAKVDHTGIDIIARKPNSNTVMGISVKSRSTNEGKVNDPLLIKNDNFEKAQRACDAFNCKPYFAIVVDQIEKIRAFILPMDEMINLYPKGRRSYQWRMAPKYIETYKQNPEIVYVEFDYATHSWFTKDTTQDKY